MQELIKTIVIPIIVILPAFVLVIRLLFKKSIMTKIGYIIIGAVIFSTVLTKLIELAGLPELLGVPVRLLIVIVSIYSLKTDIKLLHQLEININHIANYNLNAQNKSSQVNRNDELGNISVSLQNMTENLRQIIISIIEIAKSVSNAGNTLSAISQETSQSANEQAATTEQVAASIEQMTVMINSNTQNAIITGNISKKSVEEINESYEVFKKTINSVLEISTKTTVITEIADKTDMLSINASIEAARAGEVGRGFAVVAAEIRKLAEKTKASSDLITKLSKNGQDISMEASEKMAKIVPEIAYSAQLVNNIVNASMEQQSGANLINTSVQQLSQITNQNSIISEKMSGSAQQLTTQANQLLNIVSKFKV